MPITYIWEWPPSWSSTALQVKDFVDSLFRSARYVRSASWPFTIPLPIRSGSVCAKLGEERWAQRTRVWAPGACLGAQSVKHLTLGFISSDEIKPQLGLRTQRGACERWSLSSLPPSVPSLHLLSKISNIIKKKIRVKNEINKKEGLCLFQIAQQIPVRQGY